MTVLTYFSCPYCQRRNTCDFDLSEHFTDVGNSCEFCNIEFTEEEKQEIFNELDRQAAGNLIDAAEYRFGDR